MVGFGGLLVIAINKRSWFLPLEKREKGRGTVLPSERRTMDCAAKSGKRLNEGVEGVFGFIALQQTQKIILWEPFKT
jgi:hypothetical protein